MSNKSYWLYATLLAIVVCWIPISRFLLGFDHNGRIALIIILLLLFRFFFGIQSIAAKKPMVYLLLLNVFIVINSAFKGLAGYIPGTFVFASTMVCPLVFMWVVTLMAEGDFDKTLKCLFVIFYLYTVLVFAFDSVSANHQDRFGDVINSNTIAINVLFAIIFASLLYLRKQMSFLLYLGLLILPVYVEVITASRMGVIAMGIIFMAVYLLSVGLTFRSFFLFIVVGAVLWFGFNYLLENTMVGERLLMTQEQSESFSMSYGNGGILDKIGDRGAQYYLSWPTFLRNPLTGIGFGNWRLVNPLGYVCHSQYMVLYVENGVIAFILYILAVVWYIKNLIRFVRNRAVVVSRKTPVFFLVVIIVMMMINVVFWSYDAYGYYAVFALGYVSLINREKVFSI